MESSENNPFTAFARALEEELENHLTEYERLTSPDLATLDDHLALLRSKFRIEYHNIDGNNFWFIYEESTFCIGSNDQHFILRQLRKYQAEELF